MLRHMKQRQKLRLLWLRNIRMKQAQMKLMKIHLQHGTLYLRYLQAKQFQRVVLYTYMIPQPYSIRNGHVAAKIPCGDDSTPLLNILIGQAPDFTPAPLELIANLSSPGELCLYHADLPAAEQGNVSGTNSTTTFANSSTATVTDVAISNPGDEDVALPVTSTVVIGINEIAKDAHGHEE